MTTAAHVRSLYGILSLGTKHRTFRDLQKSTIQPSLHGHQVWQSSYMSMDYLLEFPLEKGSKIMEIGCGWGLLGIFCAKYFDSKVLLTDADQGVFPYATAHLTLNNVSAQIQHISYEDLNETHFNQNDVILGSDICFWPDMIEQLKDMIFRALCSNVKKIIITDPGRMSFMRLAVHCQRNYDAELIRRKLSAKTNLDGYVLVINKPA